MRVLVTGGAGFKGCVVVEALLEQGHQVTVFDALRYGEGPAMGLMRRGARVVRGDVTRLDALAPEVAGHDAVIHLAALVGFPLCDAQPLLAAAVNEEGTRNVTSLVHADQLLVYASTGSVYGRVEHLCSEAQEPEPLTTYGRTKLAAERMVLTTGGVALRFATVVGVSPCMRFDLLVNAFVYRAVQIGRMELYQPNDRRSFIDVADAAQSYVFALDHYEQMRGGVYNVGNPDLNLTKLEVAEAICEHYPMQVTINDSGRDPDQRNYEVVFDRITALGYRSLVGLTDIIDQVAASAALVEDPASWRFVG